MQSEYGAIRETMNKFSLYTIYARFFPALISALPVFILGYFIFEFTELKEVQGLILFLSNLKFLGKVTFGIIFLYFYSQLIRTTSRLIEDKYFYEEKGFPTTYLMMYNNKIFSTSYKDKYREKIKSLFQMELLDEAQEKINDQEAKKKLDEITKQVILYLGNGKLVQKYNIWYGFFRNLIGGMPYGILFCIVNIIAGTIWLDSPVLWISSLLPLFLFIFILIFHKRVLFQHSEAYAKQLISEFMVSAQDS